VAAKTSETDDGVHRHLADREVASTAGPGPMIAINRADRSRICLFLGQRAA
jgi:hypothetical protein